jgi:MoxR-like ATPase
MEMNKVIVGQKYMVERLLIGLLGTRTYFAWRSSGLAKTLNVNTYQAMWLFFESEPDLCPDVVGEIAMIYNIKANELL